jgi:hypothetical protein
VERCLACEAVVSEGTGLLTSRFPSVLFVAMPTYARTRVQLADLPAGRVHPAHHGLASEARSMDEQELIPTGPPRLEPVPPRPLSHSETEFPPGPQNLHADLILFA